MTSKTKEMQYFAKIRWQKNTDNCCHLMNIFRTIDILKTIT